MTVLNDWPTYLLKNIPLKIREGIEREAGSGSMSEVIRRILCARYGFDCEPVRMRGRAMIVDGTETMHLRLQPELWKAIRQDSKKRKVPHRTIIIEALESHYEGGVT